MKFLLKSMLVNVIHKYRVLNVSSYAMTHIHYCPHTMIHALLIILPLNTGTTVPSNCASSTATKFLSGRSPSWMKRRSHLTSNMDNST